MRFVRGTEAKSLHQPINGGSPFEYVAPKLLERATGGMFLYLKSCGSTTGCVIGYVQDMKKATGPDSNHSTYTFLCRDPSNKKYFGTIVEPGDRKAFVCFTDASLPQG